MESRDTALNVLTIALERRPIDSHGRDYSPCIRLHFTLVPVQPRGQENRLLKSGFHFRVIEILSVGRRKRLKSLTMLRLSWSSDW